jgi:hypothetical protein
MSAEETGEIGAKMWLFRVIVEMLLVNGGEEVKFGPV